jgi:hypothetical protein
VKLDKTTMSKIWSKWNAKNENKKLRKGETMRTRNFTHKALLVLVAIAIGSLTIEGRKPSPAASVPVSLVVTAEARHGGDVPLITPDEVRVYQGRDRVQVADWIPLRGDRAALELFVLLDDGASPSIGSQFDDLRAFMVLQPDTTMVGVGYMRPSPHHRPRCCGEFASSSSRQRWRLFQHLSLAFRFDQTLAG